MDIKSALIVDVECYVNYLLVMFRKVTSGEIIYFEKFDGSELDRRSLLHILSKYTIITFNGNKYDQLIMEAACAGFTNESLKKITDDIIPDKKKNPKAQSLQPWQVRKKYGFAKLDIDHVDIIEVCPLQANLKIYGGRIHSPLMQDLPIHHEAVIKESDLPLMRQYCGNDLDVTLRLFKVVEKEVDLRIKMSEEYNVDLRSKSDAQIAEAVIKHELQNNYGITPKRPKIEVGTGYTFKCPDNIEFQTEQMQEILHDFKTSVFTVGKSGHVELPEVLKNRKFHIGSTPYKIGAGGLHSAEKKTCHIAGKYLLKDYDVASFYPRIILNNELYPATMGRRFLEIFNSIVERRLAAKKSGDKVTNESLKITINGSFGKFGSKWSILYAPDLMLQVTVTGQLTLLMLVERLELAGVSVVSGNTDGIVIKMLPEQEDLVEDIVHDWEFDTGYEMESTSYVGLYSRDVNNYIAVKEDGTTKGKGAYADQTEHYYKLRKNPTETICIEAVKEFLVNKIAIEDTIRNCTDITKFISVRTVNGGAIHEDNLLGKSIRWYYSNTELDCIYYVTSGNKVPKSDGAMPIMDLPDKFPTDVDFDWYIASATKILKEIGYTDKL